MSFNYETGMIKIKNKKMKRIIIILLLMIGLKSYSQLGYKKFYFSTGITGQYMQAPKYTGYDFNWTFIPRYNIAELSAESTLSIEARPQIGVGFRDWYQYRAYDETFPMRFSYALPVLMNINMGLNSEENSLYLLGFYAGVGYSYSNVISKEPPYDPIHGLVIDAGVHIDGSPISHISAMYTIGNDGSHIYSFGFYYDF